jgi:hypothetical protein
MDVLVSGRYISICIRAGWNKVAKLNENVCEQIERAAELLREVATRHKGKVGRGAPPNTPNAEEFIDVAASLEAIVKRERRIFTADKEADVARGLRNSSFHTR